MTGPLVVAFSITILLNVPLHKTLGGVTEQQGESPKPVSHTERASGGDRRSLPPCAPHTQGEEEEKRERKREREGREKGEGREEGEGGLRQRRPRFPALCDAQNGRPQGAPSPPPSGGAGLRRDVGGPAAPGGAAGAGGGRPAAGLPLEPGGVGGREDRGLPDVLHEPALPAERRAQQHRHSGPQAGGHQAPAARHRPVSHRGEGGDKRGCAAPGGSNKGSGGQGLGLKRAWGRHGVLALPVP